LNVFSLILSIQKILKELKLLYLYVLLEEILVPFAQIVYLLISAYAVNAFQEIGKKISKRIKEHSVAKRCYALLI
jgi:hypothetical protein